MKPATLIMLCGIPCSGKTTYIHNIQNTASDPTTFNHVILSTDDYIEKMAANLNSTYSEVYDDYIDAATENLNIEFTKCVRRSEDILWDQTNLTPKSRARKLRVLPKNYSKRAIWFDVTLETALERNQNRPGKFIPESVIHRMHLQFVPPTMAEGFDDIIKIEQ